MGIKFQTVPNISLEDGIHAVRMLLPRCWFDAAKCKAGLEALQHYRRDYNARLHELKATPIHDWAEHGASAFRYLAVRHKTPEAPTPALDDFSLSYRFPDELSWMA